MAGTRDVKRVLDRVIGFIGTSVTISLNCNQYSAMAGMRDVKRVIDRVVGFIGTSVTISLNCNQYSAMAGMRDVKRVLDRVVGFIGTSVKISLNCNQYSAMADLHTFQFTVAQALGFPVSTSRPLAPFFVLLRHVAIAPTAYKAQLICYCYLASAVVYTVITQQRVYMLQYKSLYLWGLHKECKLSRKE
jgi:hypothetical protein